MDLSKVKVLGVSPGKVMIARKEILLTNVAEEDRGNLKKHTQASFENNEDGSLSLYFEDEDSKEKAHDKILRMKINNIVKEHIIIEQKNINITHEAEDFIERLSGRVTSRSEAEKYVKAGWCPLTEKEKEDKMDMLEARITALESKK